MPRYFFNVFDGHSAPDTDGTDLPDRRSARHEAIHLMSDILRSEGHKLVAGEGWRLEVADASGVILFKFDLSVTDTHAPNGRVCPGSATGEIAN